MEPKAQPRFKSWGVWIGRSPNHAKPESRARGARDLRRSPNQGRSPRKSGGRGLGRGLSEPLPRKFLGISNSKSVQSGLYLNQKSWYNRLFKENIEKHFWQTFQIIWRKIRWQFYVAIWWLNIKCYCYILCIYMPHVSNRLINKTIMHNNPLTPIGSLVTYENWPMNWPDFAASPARLGWPACKRHTVACMHWFSHILRWPPEPAVWFMSELGEVASEQGRR